MKMIALLAVAALLVLPALHAKPMEEGSLESQVLSELLQRMVEEQQGPPVKVQEDFPGKTFEEEDSELEDAEIMDKEFEDAEIMDNEFEDTETMYNEEFAEAEASTRGVTYVRWGHNRCPRIRGTRLLYTGLVAGNYYSHRGGSANYLCLPNSPDYRGLALRPPAPAITSLLYGTEYEKPIKGVHDHGAPCALCYDSTDNTQFMIPARTRCPRGFRRDYFGYLMGPLTVRNGRSAKDYICVDKDQVSAPGSVGNQNGALLYHVRAACHGLHCPPYDSNQALPCVVCSN